MSRFSQSCYRCHCRCRCRRRCRSLAVRRTSFIVLRCSCRYFTLSPESTIQSAPEVQTTVFYGSSGFLVSCHSACRSARLSSSCALFLGGSSRPWKCLARALKAPLLRRFLEAILRCLGSSFKDADTSFGPRLCFFLWNSARGAISRAACRTVPAQGSRCHYYSVWDSGFYSSFRPTRHWPPEVVTIAYFLPEPGSGKLSCFCSSYDPGSVNKSCQA